MSIETVNERIAGVISQNLARRNGAVRESIARLKFDNHNFSARALTGPPPFKFREGHAGRHTEGEKCFVAGLSIVIFAAICRF